MSLLLHILSVSIYQSQLLWIFCPLELVVDRVGLVRQEVDADLAAAEGPDQRGPRKQAPKHFRLNVFLENWKRGNSMRAVS